MALSRNTDPETSHIAADRHERAGNANSNRQKCISVLIEYPGVTAAELAEHARMERHEASRRLPELRQAGKVFNGQKRLCRVNSTLQLTWYYKHAIPKGTILLNDQHEPEPTAAPVDEPEVDPW